MIILIVLVNSMKQLHQIGMIYSTNWKINPAQETIKWELKKFFQNLTVKTSVNM